MSTMSLSQDASRLSGGLTGEVVLPGQPGFDDARQAFNLAADQEPAAVVFAGSARDVAAAITFAADHGLRIAAQGTGHNAMPLGPLTGTILLKTHRMNRVDIDPLARTARVEAGTVWSDVVQAAAKHGLAPLPGSSGNVGVAGYTLGGGVSFLGRKYGLAASSVTAIEVVTADGHLVRAGHEHHPDLFWALRGGGGSFGVVTALEFRLFPVTQAYAGALWYPIERGSDVLHAWAELTRGGPPDELTTVGRFLRLPPVPSVPPEIRGQSFVIVEAIHVGDPAQADGLLAPLRALGPVSDTIAAVPMPALSHLHMEPEQPVPATGDGFPLGRLPGPAIDALVDAAGAGAAPELVSVEVRHLGGELARPRPGNGALAAIDAEYALYAAGATPAPERVAPVRARIDAIRDALAPWAGRQLCLNFAERRQASAPFWTEEAYRRLRRVKAAADPRDLIRSNHPVPPAR